MYRFVTEGDESIPRDANSGQQGASAGGENAASAPADPNLYQKCYDYYMNFYRYVLLDYRYFCIGCLLKFCHISTKSRWAIVIVKMRCQCRAKYGVVDESPAAPTKDSDDNKKDGDAGENKSSAALSALGSYGSDSDSETDGKDND